MLSEEAVVTLQYPAITILVHPHRDDPSTLFSLVTHGLPDLAPCQRFELMLTTCLPHLEADCDTLERLAQTIITTGRHIDHESGKVRDGVHHPLIGVQQPDPSNGAVVVELMPFPDVEHSKLMTFDNRRWEEFMARLEGPEGIKCPLKEFVGPVSRLSAPKRRLLIKLADAILIRMGMIPKDSWPLLERYDSE